MKQLEDAAITKLKFGSSSIKMRPFATSFPYSLYFYNREKEEKWRREHGNKTEPVVDDIFVFSGVAITFKLANQRARKNTIIYSCGAYLRKWLEFQPVCRGTVLFSLQELLK